MSNRVKSCLAILLGSCFALLSGCGGGVAGPPAAPSDASKVMVETRDLLIEASTSGMPFKKKVDLKQFEGQFPEAAKAISDGNVVVVWGKLIKEGATTPEIIAYESAAATSEGWAVKDDGKLYKVKAADLPAAAKAAK